MKTLIFIAILIFPFFSFSQTEEDTTVYTVVEKMPEFPGGEEKLYVYLGKEFKVPECFLNSRIKSKFYFKFIVEKDGTISNIKELRNDNKNCKTNGIEILKNMPKWIPGEQRGKKMRVLYTLPIIIHYR